ncbi:MAG: glycosyltransferase family 2 protein [Solirubrobacterales bacterium]
MSVIIPTFNRAKVVTRAIDSVLEQTYRRREVIVVDDGSTDNTAEVLRSYGDRIVCIHQKNAGPSAARNRGIRESKGEFIAFLDSDDLWLATKLERQSALLVDAGPETPCCLCDSLIRMAGGQERSSFEIACLRPKEPEGLWLNPAVVLATRFVLFSQAVLVRRKFLLNCGGYDERLWLMEDHDLALRLALRGPWAFIREPLVKCWGADDNDIKLSAIASQQPAKLYESITYIDRKILEEEVALDGRLRRYLRRNLQGMERRLLAGRLAANGRMLGRVSARVIVGWDRLRNTRFRRSRSYPQIETKPIDGRASLGTGARRDGLQ